VSRVQDRLLTGNLRPQPLRDEALQEQLLGELARAKARGGEGGGVERL
jgi:hypothetical protein